MTVFQPGDTVEYREARDGSNWYSGKVSGNGSDAEGPYVRLTNDRGQTRFIRPTHLRKTTP